MEITYPAAKIRRITLIFHVDFLLQDKNFVFDKR